MGLTISSGEYAYYVRENPAGAERMEEDLERINNALRENGVKEHDEPKEIPETSMSCIEGFPYSFLHHLRRIFALNRLDKNVIRTDGDLTSEDDSVVMEATEMMDSHLLCHSDVEGYYVPIEFEEVIFDDELPGGMLGSSQKLLAEIIKIAYLIGIETDKGEISKETYDKLAKADENHHFHVERVVWFALYEHCKKSIESNTIISFG